MVKDSAWKNKYHISRSIFSDEDFLHPDSSGLSFFLAPSSLQTAPSMWNSIKSGFGNIFGNFG